MATTVTNIITILLISLGTSFAALGIPYVLNDNLKEVTGVFIPPGKSVSHFRRLLNLPPSSIYPVFCSNDISRKQLELWDKASQVDPTGFGYVFVKFKEEDKTFFVFVCHGTTFKQLKETVVEQLKLVKPDRQLSEEAAKRLSSKTAKDIAFEGILDESKRIDVFEALPSPIFPAGHKNVRFDITRDAAQMINAYTAHPPAKKRAQIEHMHGETFTLKVPKKGVLKLNNVDTSKDIGYLRDLIESQLGVGEDFHKMLAICRPDGNEARDSDSIKSVFGTSVREIPSNYVPYTDWITKKKTKHKVTVCPGSTHLQVIRRALPGSWKLAVGEYRVPTVYNYTLEHKKRKEEGVIFEATDLIDLSAVVQPIASKPAKKDTVQYYVVLEDSMVIRLLDKEIFLPDGTYTSFARIKEILVSATSRSKGWLYAFCDANAEIGPNDILETHHRSPTFLKRQQDTTGARNLTRNLLVVSSSGASEEHEHIVEYCQTTNYYNLATRIYGLAELNVEDKLSFLLLREGKHDKVTNWNTLVHTTEHPPPKILAVLGGGDLPAVRRKNKWIDKYIAVMSEFRAVLSGLGAGMEVLNVSPLTTLKAFREMLLATRDDRVAKETIRRYAFCVPSGVHLPREGEEMDEKKTFAYYGIPGTKKDILLANKVVRIANWVSGRNETMTVSACLGSTYKQVAIRALDNADESLLKRIRIVVEDESPADKNEVRQSYEITDYSRRLEKDEKLVLRDPPKPDSKASTIYLLSNDASIVRIRGELIPIGKPETTQVGILREYFLNKDKKDAWKYAFCAPTGNLFWKAIEMDPNLSFAAYGYLADRWHVHSSPATLTIIYIIEGSPTEVTDFEYCPRSTPDDIEHRVLMLSGMDPSKYRVASLYPELLWYPNYTVWKMTGDATFAPKKLHADIVPVERINVTGMKPTDRQMPSIAIKKIAHSGKEPTADNPAAQQEIENLLIKALKDPSDIRRPDVLVFVGESNQ